MRTATKKCEFCQKEFTFQTRSTKETAKRKFCNLLCARHARESKFTPEEAKARTLHRSRVWKLNNPEKVGIYRKNQYQENREEQIRSKIYYQNNKSKCLVRASGIVLAKFGLDHASYHELLNTQNGLCAICKKGPDGRRRLGIDHDHDKLTIRGLLCIRCNIGLGQFLDSVELLQAAKEYLTSPPFKIPMKKPKPDPRRVKKGVK